MPEYINFLSVFGQEDRPRNLHYSDFRKQLALEQSVQGLYLPDMRRSGKGYQMCYNLKSVGTDEDKLNSMESDPEKRKYLPGEKKITTRVFRQVAVHHQMDTENGTALWIFTHGRWDVAKRVGTFVGDNGRPEDRDYKDREASFKAILTMHLLLAEWAAEEWQPYLEELEDAIDYTVRSVCVDKSVCKLTIGQTSDALKIPKKPFTPTNLMDIQVLEEKAGEAKQHLLDNKRILSSLAEFYQELINNVAFPLRGPLDQAAVQAFVNKITIMTGDIEAQIHRLTTLHRTTADRKSLVRIRNCRESRL
jgi:hypothetical protein